ncbi:TPA: glycosyltransferase [archaeon]|uniref:Glycosyltransferase n=1 Tax=Candidatus Naiadarchaeum limnaeum TaxID=2756139 RepID=A0A832V1X6_9ARCH|nr:glycosyltransferase [Candidatus Naiadarchaeum limnaeum]
MITTFLSKVFGTVMSSYLGGFGTSQIQPTKEMFVDSLSFCAFRKKVLREVGLNDPKFKVGQDAELNIRIRKAGYKFLYTPKTFVWYYKRSTFSGFFAQMFRYGWARAKMIRKHPDTSRIFYFGPTIFTTVLIALILAALKSNLAQFLLALFLIIYGGMVLSSSIRRANSVRFVLAAFFAYWIEHLAYGIGFLYGAIN